MYFIIFKHILQLILEGQGFLQGIAVWEQGDVYKYLSFLNYDHFNSLTLSNLLTLPSSKTVCLHYFLLLFITSITVLYAALH